jgi:hypothetical protein
VANFFAKRTGKDLMIPKVGRKDFTILRALKSEVGIPERFTGLIAKCLRWASQKQVQRSPPFLIFWPQRRLYRGDQFVQITTPPPELFG